MNIDTDDINEITFEEYYDFCLKELNSLIGLETVKEEVKKMVDYLLFYRKVSNKVKYNNINLNMIFRGNPGTGKTTIAKIIARLLYSMGYVKSPTVLETTPRDFIAGYVGQTSEKTHRVIKSAQGGVIFIDEAYGFVGSLDENGKSFAPDAITEIIKEMEKRETVFIFAGYSKEMENFINLNSGIKSRVGYDFVFEDYSLDNLFDMFLNKIRKYGFDMKEDAMLKVVDIIKERMTVKNFGNGRMIDNLFDEILREHASITKNEIDMEKLLVFSIDSVNNIKQNLKGSGYFA